LGLGSAAAAVAGEAVAVGIFLTPAAMAKALGSPFWLLVAWLVMGGMALSGALCYAELASRFPEAGGGYVYLREAFGSRLAFLYGWMSLLVMDPGITAALGMGLASYTAYIFGLSFLHMKLFAIAVILALTALNILNTRLGAGFLRWMTWLKFGVLGLLAAWALIFRLGSWSHFAPFFAQRAGSLPLAQGFAVALVAAFFSFGGWWDASKIAGEIRDPVRTLPRALILGVVAVMLLYVFISAVFLYLVPLDRVTSDQTFVAQAGEVLFGTAGGKILAAIVIACVLGSLAALIISSPRVYYAMAKDGLFFHSVAQVHARFGTPARAIAIQGLMASLLVTLGSFNEIIAYFIFVAVLFLGLTVVGVFVLHRRGASPHTNRFGYPFASIAFVLLVVFLLALLAVRNPIQALLGVAVVSLGAPIYSVLKRSAS